MYKMRERKKKDQDKDFKSSDNLKRAFDCKSKKVLYNCYLLILECCDNRSSWSIVIQELWDHEWGNHKGKLFNSLVKCWWQQRI